MWQEKASFCRMREMGVISCQLNCYYSIDEQRQNSDEKYKERGYDIYRINEDSWSNIGLITDLEFTS